MGNRRPYLLFARPAGALAFVLLALLALAPARGRSADVFAVDALAPTAVAADAGARPYVVILHPQRAESELDRRFLARVFLKKVTTWEDGETIRPVDLATDSPIRRRFSDEVLGRSVSAVRNYWQQLIFAGRGVPPPELDSEEAVVRYVQRHPGAIGYVSGAVNVGNTRVAQIR